MGWFKAVVPMEMSDEKPPVSSLLDDCRGACGDAGGGPATRLLRGGPTGRRHRRAHGGAAHHKPKHLPIGACNQPAATAGAGRLRHSAEIGAARSAVAEPIGQHAAGDGPQPRAERLHPPIARTDRTGRALFAARLRLARPLLSLPSLGSSIAAATRCRRHAGSDRKPASHASLSRPTLPQASVHRGERSATDGRPCTRILKELSVAVGSRLRPVLITEIKPPRRLIALTDGGPDDDVILT